jgi:SAM-dependent methyltransferase
VSRPPADEDEVTARLIAAQRAYYDLRAPDYGDVDRPSDRRSPGLISPEQVRTLVRELGVTGDVLELACGSGAFTRELVRYASSLTALDGSPKMLELNRHVVGDEGVEYVCADVFRWSPTRRFDFVFFGFWLSHVPPAHFDAFWETVRSCLRPGGRVAFVDEDARARDNEAAVSDDPAAPAARRTLGDGRAFDIVKVFWHPDDLERHLRATGWDAHVRPIGDTFLYGSATVS